MIAVKDLVYARFHRDRIEVKNLRTGARAVAEAQSPFTTRRLLVGDFYAAVDTLVGALAKVDVLRSVFRAPKILVQPMEMNDGGFSPVEERALVEVARAAGACEVRFHDGETLSDEAARALLRPRWTWRRERSRAG